MSFSDILGQERVMERLKKSIKSKKVFHSYIFHGPEGVGKKATALSFAQALNCKNYLDDACNVCPSCKKNLSGNHPDVRIIIPGGKGEKIKIDQTREIIKETYFLPYEGNYKIYIFQEAEKTSPEAAGAFLKVLEEPYPYNVFILITTNLEDLLPTIVSRCSIVKFNYLTSKTIFHILKKEKNIPEELLSPISELSYGNLKKAKEEGEKILSDRNKIVSILSLLSKVDYILSLKVAEEIIHFAKSKEKPEREVILDVLDIILLWFRDLTLLKCGVNKNLIINRDILSGLQNEVENYNLSDLPNIIQIIKDTKTYIARYANISAALTIMFLNICGALT